MTDKLKIEKGVPIPMGWHRRGRPWPFESMKPGESFVVDNLKDMLGIRYAACRYKKYHPGFDYTARRIEDDKYRFWRLS